MANMTFKANLLPNSDLEYNLGSSDKRWIINGWNLIPLQYWTGDSDNPIFIKLNQTIKSSGNFYFFGIIKLLYSNTLRKPSIITFQARQVGDTGGFDRAIFYDPLLAINGLTIFRDENNYIYLKLTPNGKYQNFQFSVAEASNNLKQQQLAIEVLTVSPNIYQETVFERAMIPNATTAIAGLMSAADKEKLDGIAEGAISGVTSIRVQATSPIISSSSAASSTILNTTISLDDEYGDKKNPYGTKNKNLILATPSNTSGVPSFRALVENDIPQLNASKINAGTLDFDRLPTMYWANIKISNTSATNTTPTFKDIIFNKVTSSSTHTPRLYVNSDNLLVLGDFTGTTAYYVFNSSHFRPASYVEGELDLGSSSYKWKDLYLTGNIVAANTTLSGTLNVTGATTLSDNVIVGGQLTTNSLTVNGNSQFNNSVNFNSLPTIGNQPLLQALGLSNALHFIGIATTAITDGGTENPNISTYDFSNNRQKGDVVLYNNLEYIWTNSNKWEQLGDDRSFALNSISITGTEGLTGGGNLTTNRLISHDIPSGASATTYNNNDSNRTYIKTITTDKFGHITNVTTGSETVTNTNYYPTAFSWTNGTTAGPTGLLTMEGSNNVSFGAIPTASDTYYGVTKLSSATNSSATNLAATPAAVQAAIQVSAYAGSIQTTSAATYNTEPEVKSIKITGNTSANTIATNGVVLQYDATLKVLNFVFA